MTVVMFIAGSVAFAVAGLLTPALASWARARGLLDVPNDRSSHVEATPRIGGVAIVAAVIAGAVASHFFGEGPGSRAGRVLILAVGMGILGFADDIRPLPARVRLAVQSAIAVMTLLLLGPAALPWLPAMLAALVTAFWIVAVTNAFNFMDGIDGIAGAQALVAGLGWAALGAIAGWADPMLLGALAALASGAFLLYNWQPARVFMGDAGSGFLGFLFAALPLAAPADSPAPWGYAVLLLWPFLFDTGFTLVRRLTRRENVFSAHRTHLYQRLTLTGMSHRDVATFYAAATTVGGVAAVLIATAHPMSAGALIAVLSLAAFSLWRVVIVREARRRSVARA